MPIEIRVVTQAQYEAWLERVTGNSVEDARQYLAEITNESPVQLASVQ